MTRVTTSASAPDADGADGRAPAAAPALLRPIATGWWGKLPTQGDFVGDGLPLAWRHVWDDWLQRALAQALGRFGRDGLRARLLAMPPWQCLVPAADGGTAWAGVVLAAGDRVGRVFPMLLVEGYAADALDAAGVHALQRRALRLADWLDQVGVLSGPTDFAAGARAIGDEGWDASPPHAAATPAGDAPPAPAAAVDATVGALRAAHPGAGSFWWRPEPVGALPPPRVEPWPPSDALVTRWLGDATVVGPAAPADPAYRADSADASGG